MNILYEVSGNPCSGQHITISSTDTATVPAMPRLSAKISGIIHWTVVYSQNAIPQTSTPRNSLIPRNGHAVPAN